MKKVILFVLSSFLVISCTSSDCDFYKKNKNQLEELLDLIKNKPEEFFNNKSKPRSYLTYNYQKDYVNFQKTTSSKNINKNEYEVLKKLFNQLSIDEIIIYDDKNILFKVKDFDFSINKLNLYIGYTEQKTLKNINEDFEVIEYEKCENYWYSLVIRTSITR